MSSFKYCPNCDGVKCMGCVTRDPDHTCADDCPACCNGLVGLIDFHFPHYVEPWEGPTEHALECGCGASWVDYSQDMESLWAQHLADALAGDNRWEQTT